MKSLNWAAKFGAVAALSILGACATAAPPGVTVEPYLTASERAEKFEQDRAAILAMTGDYRVTFDFTETVSFQDGYELKETYTTGAQEVVRIVEDSGDFISMQHILVIGGGEDGFPVKHWRQDWVYEPDSIPDYIGGNAWERRAVTPAESRGKWAQVVYQVDDAPRYAGVAAWRHENGVSEWTSPRSWRPLPRRDATKRDDYHTIAAVNRHAITPAGWVHEQDNSKLILTGGAPVLLAREIGVNSYVHADDYDTDIADSYWADTKDYWAAVRAEWTRLETDYAAFGLTIQGEPEELYMQILGLASQMREGEMSLEAAIEEARGVIADYTITEIGDLADRLSGAATGGDY